MAKTTPEMLVAVTARVLDRFTASAMLFTALDVSNAVKETLPDVRHRDVSPLVREIFDGEGLGSYQQTQIDVVAAGKTVQALLYHLPTHDPARYDDSMRSQLARPPGAAKDDAVTDIRIEDTTLGASVPIGDDGRGRVSRRLLSNAGIEGDEVLLQVKSGSLVLSSADQDDEPDDAELLSCEHPDLLYLSPEQLQGFGAGAQLAARIEDGNVIISSSTYAPPLDGFGFAPYPLM
ncbi:MAG: hypothetical protein Q8N23_22940 [Archangium sp.]|nr:hypothetical protein [Archangium sp.]MDP3570847.1 hypothetical protein [Archangium sp.]